jgi:hypothetical protein
MHVLLAWLRQPTSVAGISALSGTFLALLTHQISWAQAMPLIAGGLTSIALPDDAGAKANAESLARAIAIEVNQGKPNQ